jgi:hypothetical protein
MRADENSLPISHTSVRSRAQPLTTRGCDGVLRGEIDGLSQESEEGMWTDRESRDSRNEATAAPATVSGERLPDATEIRPHDGSGRRQGATTREPGNLPSFFFACRAGCLGERSDAGDHKFGWLSDHGVGLYHLSSIHRPERLTA